MAVEPGPYIEIIKCICRPICEYWNYHRKVKDYLTTLKEKKEELKCRKHDVGMTLRDQLRFGKETKKEVEKWLQKAETIITEAENIEGEATQINYLCRASLGKKVYGKIQKMIEALDDDLPDSLVNNVSVNSEITFPVPELVGATTVKKEIWAYLIDDNVCKIGVCGMGGSGKTTIMKHIYNELKEMKLFTTIIWVTMPKEFDVVKVMKDIAFALNEDLPDCEDETTRAAMLLKRWKRGERYVVILDDVWQEFSLADVGIPDPTIGNGCKLVLTTRSVEVVRSMCREIVKVKPLSDQEALNLFLNHVGRDVLRIPKLESTLESIVRQCANLPLAIVTIACSMKGEEDIRVWRNALNELEERTRGSAAKVIDCLKFSYDRLKDIKIKHCFLYCALYPDDFEIPREELIEYWIVEGLIDERRSRQAMYDKGDTILNGLENNCLLERANSETHVKMHDLVREMALHVTSRNPRYLVKAGMQLEDLPEQQEWTDGVEKVSLMENGIEEIPSDLALPKCATLLTLLLQKNRLKTIHESFFLLMSELKILDLSHNRSIKELPGSISDLENLTALLLHGCSDLKHVPCLAKLRALKKLDLGATSIEGVPHGLELLALLTYLDLNVKGLEEFPGGILPKLSRLQHLRLDSVLVKAEEATELRKLETFGVLFSNLEDYNQYFSCRQKECLNKYLIHVGSWKCLKCYPAIWKTTTDTYFSEEWNFLEYGRCVRFEGLGMCGKSILLPTDIQELHIQSCCDISSVSDHFSSLKNATDLRRCRVLNCEVIECLVSSSSSCKILQSIEKLSLHNLGNFSILFTGERDGAAVISPTPPGIFSQLKSIEMTNCPNIEKLFWPELLQHLCNVEEIQVRGCKQLKEIIAATDDEEHSNKFCLPKLRIMAFSELPELKCICSRHSVMVCDSVEYIEICECPNVKRIPLSLTQRDNGQFGPPVPRATVKVCSEECWNSLEWDHPDIKNVFRFNVRPLQPGRSYVEADPCHYPYSTPTRLERDCMSVRDEVNGGISCVVM